MDKSFHPYKIHYNINTELFTNYNVSATTNNSITNVPCSIEMISVSIVWI